MLKTLIKSIGTVLFAVLIAVVLIVAALAVLGIGFYCALWPPKPRHSTALTLAGRVLRR